MKTAIAFGNRGGDTRMANKTKTKAPYERQVERMTSRLSVIMNSRLQNRIEDIKAAFLTESRRHKPVRKFDVKTLDALAAESLIYVPVEKYFDLGVQSALTEAHETGAKIKQIKSGFQLTDSELAKLLGVALRTVGYWKSGKTKRLLSLSKERLDRVFDVYLELSKVLRSPFLRRWLFEPGAVLGDSPFNLLVNGRFEKVLSEVEALKEGVHA
jgi:DNA-binding transcriptional regulator YiaG